MTANHPEEEEEKPEDEKHSDNTNRWRPWRRSCTLTAFLAAAGVGVVVGTGSVVIRAASSMKSLKNIRVNSNVQMQPIPIDEHEYVGAGNCLDKDGNYYPSFYFRGVTTADACAKKCKCIKNDRTVTFQGFAHWWQSENLNRCNCYIDGPVETDAAGPVATKYQASGVQDFKLTGTGEITSTNSDSYICYKKLGGKAGKTKTKADKAED